MERSETDYIPGRRKMQNEYLKKKVSMPLGNKCTVVIEK